MGNAHIRWGEKNTRHALLRTLSEHSSRGRKKQSISRDQGGGVVPLHKGNHQVRIHKKRSSRARVCVCVLRVRVV